MKVFRAHHVETQKAEARKHRDSLARKAAREARRNQWIAQHGPCAKCGSSDRLEIDHIIPELKKIEASAALNMAVDNPLRIAELEKCQVLCRECHKEKTRQYLQATHPQGIQVFQKRYAAAGATNV